MNYETLPDDLQISKLSKKKQKQIKRLKVGELKLMVKKPDVVDVWDVTAPDPFFLIWLKSFRNSVPVPKHWSQKRKFLQYKRGIQKAPFMLPEYIEATGVGRIRNTLTHNPGRNIKQKLRERMNPKLGKMEVEYQSLYDAFYKHQIKPSLTIHGDVYYEGKEYEIKMRKYRPGRVSVDLRMALGIPEGTPPPWLINMQRHGPPPAYPNLKIPGVNCPLPMNMSWQKLMADDRGNTVYADCYGLTKEYKERIITSVEHWGKLKEEETVEEQPPDEIKEKESEEEETKKEVAAEATVEYTTMDMEIDKVNIQKVTIPEIPKEEKEDNKKKEEAKEDKEAKEVDEKYSKFKF